MDGKIVPVLGLVLALAGRLPVPVSGVAVRSSTTSSSPAEHRDEVVNVISDPRTRIEDAKRVLERRQAGLVLGTYSLVGSDRPGVHYSTNPFAAVGSRDAGGPALFFRTAPSEPGATYTLQAPYPYSSTGPLFRIAYATPVVAVHGQVGDKDRPGALVLVPGPPATRTSAPTSQARVVSVSVQNAEGETLPSPPAAAVQERDQEDVDEEHSTPVPAPSTPAPVFEQRSPQPPPAPPVQAVESSTLRGVVRAPPAPFVQVVESTSPQAVIQSPLISVKLPPVPQQLVQQPLREDGVDAGLKGGHSQVHQRQKEATHLLVNTQHVPLLGALGHLGPTPSPIFLFGHPHAALGGSGSHGGALFIPSSPAPQSVQYPANGHSSAPVHFATAPGYTSTVFTTFSSPFVSYSY